MKKILFAFFLLPLFSFAQVLEIEHLHVLVDTVPFRFSGSPNSNDYTRYREIRIGCLNSGKNDLYFTGAKQSFTNDTSWLKVADNVKFPAVLKAGTYGEISIIYSVFSPYQRIQILSNSKTGPQIITILDNYKEPLEFKRSITAYPAKIKEGEVAHFSSTICNNGNKKITIDSVSIPDSSMKLLTPLPIVIAPGKNIPVSLTASTTGKKNFYYGGSPLFFYHPENAFEDFAKQEFSCIIIPNLSMTDQDTFNFQTVKRGATVTQTFHFKNEGSFTLMSSKSKTDCISFDKDSISPGEKFSVTIKYNTTLADSGKITREFPVLLQPFFYSNSVFLSGNIKGSGIHKDKLLLADKPIMDCGTISNDSVKTLKRDFKIKNTSGLPILISSVNTADGGSYAFCDKKTEIAPGEFFVVSFVYNAKKVGSFDKTINVAFTTGDCSPGEYYYVLTIKGNIIAK